ncbi:glycoside hydrolase family 61 protein-like protein [Clohesyomyces aquaticus]|uniref:AA9 family lytic polysaccharide monooxygenase n=1 Tax=Clohesyomyces aquaticus TaxID=1231657 RepID=A0A1Y1YLZ4_9PLEO|nr:glycoside hydrolase family 61 protein-like protein [Clohesyomyces aquaticus]
MRSFTLWVLVTFLAIQVSAHGGIWNYSIAGNWQPGFFPYYPAEGQSSIQRHWAAFRPIKDLNSPYLVCNNPGTSAEKYATIRAGGEIKAYYPGWPHDIGVVIVWMAFCGPVPDSCFSFNGTGNHWFKIQQVGLQSGTIRDGHWALKDLIANNYTWSTTIPASLHHGAYLIRHEIIALHVPYEPEFYPECAHLFVEGSGWAGASGKYLAELPGVWNGDDPSLNLTIYQEPTASKTEWAIPGPPVWSGNNA